MIQKKNNRIANLRALAIITVVLGHSIIIYSSSWNIMPTDNTCIFFDKLKNVINFYQMELYFFISGFLFFKTVGKDITYLSFIKGKILRLLIPYIFFGIFWMLPVKMLLDIPTYHNLCILNILYKFFIGYDNGHLWFLYALFIVFLCLYPLNKVMRKYKFGSIFISLLCLLASMKGLGFYMFDISQAVKYLFWFQLGYVMNDFKDNEKYRLLIFAFIAVLLLWRIRVDMLISLVIVIGLYYIIPDKEQKYLSVIDKHSYGIYLFHSPLIYITYTFIPNESPFLVFFINFIIMGFIAFLLTRFVKISPLNKVLYI